MSEPLTNDGWPRRPRKARTTDIAAWFYVDAGGIDILIETAKPIGHARLTWKQIWAAIAARARAKGGSDERR